MDHDFGDIVEHLRSHAGDAVQVVLIYDADDHTDLYRRSDLTDLHDSALEQRLISMARADRPDAAGGRGTDGPHRATVRVFDTRVVIHLPRDNVSGTVVTFDPSVARNLTQFVTDIRGDIYDE